MLLKVRKERQPKEFLINVKQVRVRFAGSQGNMTSRAGQRTLEGEVPETSTMPQGTRDHTTVDVNVKDQALSHFKMIA